MTDDRRPDDELLSDRIRRSMAHYTFNRALRPPKPALSPWRWPMLMAAALGGAAAATIAISLLGGLQRGPIGNATPGPSVTDVQSPGPSTPASPAIAPISEQEAAASCLGQHEVQDSWVLPGESAEDVAQRLRQLPLVHTETQDDDGFFVYADDRFNVLCELTRGSEGALDKSIYTGPLEPHGGGLEYSGGGSAPGSAEPGGQRPDMFMYGTSAPRFVRVEIVLADGGAVPAWLGDGLWFAWWQEPTSSVAIRGYDTVGNVTILHEGLRFIPVEPEPTTREVPRSPDE